MKILDRSLDIEFGHGILVPVDNTRYVGVQNF